ncbi:Transposase DDE domain protein [Planctomycetes bacterium Pan216]|uniref:Transposase DDE domain protein n=1 Tax=Kolteria novifilia TaxID=2527975 RepID=A0A518B3Z2_9BACT|nr:Transposase DDE domain protein [Planctomycetes bacterium Pan216]
MCQDLVAVFTPFENLTDPRVERTRAHELFDMVVVALCGTIAGSDSWADVERFGKERLDWLRTFLRLENGIASHDTFGRVFARLDPAELTNCVQQWLADVSRDLGRHVAIDGKTLRGSFDKAAGRNPLHLMSAWASEARLTLGQVAVDSKSNEITAIPLLLELLDLDGATVTIDAMGCQKEIAAKIAERGGDYVLALKGNHEKLHEAVQGEFLQAAEGDFQTPGVRRHVTVETSHGRDERREYTIMPAPKTLPGFEDWVGLLSIGMVLRLINTHDGVERAEISYFLTSLPPKVKAFARAVRRHWSIENQLHWVLDVTFTEDASRIRKQRGPQTAAMLRRLAVSIISSDTSVKDSIRGKRYSASLSTEVLERILLSFVAK